MKVNDLCNGQVVRLRTGLAGREDVTWNDWTIASIYVQRDPRGKVCLIGVSLPDGSGVPWPEYDPRHDLERDGILVVEDYYLEIDGLEVG